MAFLAHLRFQLLRELLAMVCLLSLSWVGLQAQVIDESTPQDGLWVGVGPNSADFVGQDFVASVKRVRKIGVYLQGLVGTGEVRLSIMKDNGFNQPDLNFVLHESQIIMPDTAGGWVYDSTFSGAFTVGDKYWIVVDGYNNLIGSGYSAVGTSNTFTSTSDPMRYSVDGGLTWASNIGVTMAIFVEGDNCGGTLNISPQQPQLCPGGTVTFGVPSGQVSYQWLSGQTSSTITVGLLGIYTVRAVDTSNCVSTASVLVVQGTIPFSGLDNYYEICSGQSLQLSLPPFYIGYVWSTGTIGNRDSIVTSGNYWTSITSASNCVLVDSFQLYVRPYANLDIGRDTSLCVGDTVSLSVDSGYVHYLWSTGNVNNSELLYATTNAWVQVIDSLGCVSVSDTVNYAFNPKPAVPIIQVLPAGLHASFANGYTWYYNGQLLAGQTAQDVPDPLPGWYAVTISNAFGCEEYSDSVRVVDAAPGNFVSGGFSPNGDGLNEVFFVEGIDRYPDCHLQVFSRWGEKVHDEQPYINDWRGTNATGGELPVGDYYYILEFGAGRETLRGTVLISR